MATGEVWYEPRWSHELKSVNFNETAQSVRAKVLKLWKMVARNPLRDCISEGLLRYCRALDQHDMDAALVGLWGALEYLTGTQKEKYDVTIRRVLRVFKNPNFARQIAMSVRTYRNSTIHAARSLNGEEADAVILQAEMLVRQLLLFYVFNEPKLKCQKDIVNFLDLSLNLDEVRWEREIIDSYIAYRDR